MTNPEETQRVVNKIIAHCQTKSAAKRLIKGRATKRINRDLGDVQWCCGQATRYGIPVHAYVASIAHSHPDLARRVQRLLALEERQRIGRLQ